MDRAAVAMPIQFWEHVVAVESISTTVLAIKGKQVEQASL